MQKLTVFNNVSLDGYFVGAQGDMSWAHRGADDAEWNAFVSGNAQGGGQLVFGRITYEMMAGFWPTPQAAERMPAVAQGMNRAAKFVFSKSLQEVGWENTTLLSGELAADIRRLKQGPGRGLTILGSGSLVPPLAEAGLIDEFQLVIVPVILGAGRTLFEGLRTRPALRLLRSRSFANGNLFAAYAPA